MTDDTLTVVEQKEVLFYDDTIVAVRLADGSVFVPLRPIVESLGMSWTGQYERLGRNEVLGAKLRSVRITRTEQNRTRQLAMQCLPIEYLNGWLFGISTRRIKNVVRRERIIQYQEKCHLALYDAFKEGRLSTTEASLEAILQGDSPAAQAYRMAQAIMQMARQQVLMEARIDQHDTTLADYSRRIETIESTLGNPERQITVAQASQISQAVKAIGLEMGRRSGRNEFGGVYGELYRRFDITSYKELPTARVEEAVRFLREWYGAITNTTEIPF